MPRGWWLLPSIVIGAIIWIVLASYALAEGLPRDKIGHALTGLAIYSTAEKAGADRNQALALCAAAGVAKELWDATGRGDPDPADILATASLCILRYAIDTQRQTANPFLRPSPPVSRHDRAALIAYANRR